MKNISCLSLVAFLFSLSTVSAALPPLYESLREIEAILTDNQLSQKLTGDQMITSINRTDEGFVVITNKCSMHVDVKYHTSNKGSEMHVGPQQFELVFHDSVCKPNSNGNENQ